MIFRKNCICHTSLSLTLCVYMIKVSGKVDKLTIIMDSIFRSLFKKELSQNKNEFFLSSAIKKLLNFRKTHFNSVVSVGLSTFFLIFIILLDLPKSTISPYIYYKNLFLRKNQTDNARHLIWLEWKREK